MELHIFTAVLTPLLLLGIPKDRHEVTRPITLKCSFNSNHLCLQYSSLVIVFKLPTTHDIFFPTFKKPPGSQSPYISITGYINSSILCILYYRSFGNKFSSLYMIFRQFSQVIFITIFKNRLPNSLLVPFFEYQKKRVPTKWDRPSWELLFSSIQNNSRKSWLSWLHRNSCSEDL